MPDYRLPRCSLSPLSPHCDRCHAAQLLTGRAADAEVELKTLQQRLRTLQATASELRGALKGLHEQEEELQRRLQSSDLEKVCVLAELIASSAARE